MSPKTQPLTEVDSVQSLTEVDSVQPSEVTTASEQEMNSPEAVEEQKHDERVFGQAELDAILEKRLSRERRKWERDQSSKLVEIQAKERSLKGTPHPDQFETVDAYAEALAEKRADELIQQREATKYQQEILDRYEEKAEEVRGAFDDFDQVVNNPSLHISNEMAEMIRSSDIGPSMAYHLGKNPQEASRIARLSPLQQAKEIGKIEVMLSTNQPVKKTTSAPAPIRPVTARASNSRVTDTTDPRSTQSMSVSEWIEAERQRQIIKAKSLRNY